MKVLSIFMHTSKKMTRGTSVPAFTLLEALVATMLISTVIVGPLTLIINNVSFARNSRDVLTATGLALESIELLRYRRDSQFVACSASLSVPSATDCSMRAAEGTAGDPETPSEAAWRIFKTDMSTTISATCVVTSIDPDGCTYDTQSFMVPLSTKPQVMNPHTDSCPTLLVGLGGAYEGLYVCKDTVASVPSFATAFRASPYIRNVKLVRIAPASLTSYDEAYRDEFRIESTVNFRTASGLVKTVRVVDYLRARP